MRQVRAAEGEEGRRVSQGVPRSKPERPGSLLVAQDGDTGVGVGPQVQTNL